MQFDLWKWFQESGALGNTVGTIVAAAVLGTLALIPKVRRPVWAAMRGATAFVLSFRVKTTKQIEAAKEEARQEVRAELTGAPGPKAKHVYRLVPEDEFKQLTSPPQAVDPVTWSARLRGGKTLVFKNLSKNVTAFNVELSSGGALMSPGGKRPFWEEIGPGEVVEHPTSINKVAGSTRRATLKVVWDDAEGRAHENRVVVLGV